MSRSKKRLIFYCFFRFLKIDKMLILLPRLLGKITYLLNSTTSGIL